MSIAHLLSVTASLDAPRIFERSVKLSDGGMADDRGLISMNKRALYPGPKTTLSEICAALGCRDSSGLAPYLGAAHSVHFGVDGDISKCYLEFPPERAPAPHLVFLALKWRGDEIRLNQYTSIAHRPHADKASLIDMLLPDGPVRAVAHDCLALARNGDPDHEAVVLHVTETGSPRVSIDISVADAGQSMSDATPTIAPMFDAFNLDAAAFLKASADARFGHIALGSDEGGALFSTLYFGARQI